MRLCTIPDLRGRAGVTGGQDDLALATAIDLAGALIESHLNRNLDRVVGATYTTHAGCYSYQLPRFPVEVVSKVEIKESEADGWRTLTANDLSYLIEEESGLVTLGNQVGSDMNLIRWTYTGGYRQPGDVVGTYELPQAIISAATEQAAWLYQHRHALRLTGTPRGSEAIRQTQDMDLLETVKLALQPYRRIVI